MNKPNKCYSLPNCKSGKEMFKVKGKTAGFALYDYWQWSGSDLLSNAQRGVLAEYLVAEALSVTSSPRLEWAWYDLETQEGKYIEVKSAAFYQSWPQVRPSSIKFDIAPRKWLWDPKTNETLVYDRPTRRSDAYVFCLLGSLEETNPDPLDLDQWTFFVLDTDSLNCEVRSQKTISLNPLKLLVNRLPNGREVKYPGLSAAIMKSTKSQEY